MSYFGTYFGDYGGSTPADGKWSAAYLVSMCRRLSGLPAIDTVMSDQRWCEYLSLAQDHWLGIISAKVPESQYSAPIELVYSSDRKTASFPDGAVPFGRVQIFDGVNGRQLTPGEYGDPMADFVPEGSVLRAPIDRTFSFSNNLVARYTDMRNTEIWTEVGAEEAGIEPREPILMPEFARVLLVYHACALWASQGGFRDPTYYEHLELKAAWDDPETGKIGIVTQLMSQFQDQGASQAASQVWWRSGDLGNLRHQHRVL